MMGELTPTEIEQLLDGEVVGRIGCMHGGRPYVVPVTYAYDGEAVYCHSAVGWKIQSMREDPEVCFEVEHVASMSDWRSVIAWGHYEELHGAAAMEGMGVLLARMMPLMADEANQPAHGMGGPPHGMGGESHAQDVAGHEAVIYRIRLHTKTGRFERRHA